MIGLLSSDINLFMTSVTITTLEACESKFKMAEKPEFSLIMLPSDTQIGTAYLKSPFKTLVYRIRAKLAFT